MSYEALREEYLRDRIGPQLWALILEIAGRIGRKYPPAIYNNGINWGDESIEDLAQEVTLARLLEENQLDYIFTTASETRHNQLDAVSRLLAFQVQRVLSHRRRKTVVDRLFTRIRALISESPFRVATEGNNIVISLGQIDLAARVLTDDEIQHAASLIQSIPRIPSRVDAERDSKVYTKMHLEELVTAILDSYGTVFLGDIRRILELSLTAWVPTFLHIDEEEFASDTRPELEFERTQMHTMVTAVVSDLEAIHRMVLIGKSQGISDSDLAHRAGRSRPWLAERKTEVLTKIQTDILDQLPVTLHDEAFRYMIDICATYEEAEP